MGAITVAALVIVSLASASADFTMCVLPQTPSYHSPADICGRLWSTQFRCVIAIDRLDCMKKISTGEADFAVFEAEDILIAADDKHLSDILITHKIHSTEDRKWEFGVVALVSNKANILKLADLKGKRLCHPGVDTQSTIYDWSDVFSLYFENRVAPQICEDGVSIEENRIKALSGFFGESCKAGQWAADPDLDTELKRKYKSMCDLCDVPSVCSRRDKYWGRQGALYCLSDCLGDVAWSMLKDAKLHFSNVGLSVCDDVSLLCPDGTTMPLNSTDPCVWLTRPVPVIAAKRIKAEAIQSVLKQTLKMPDVPDDFIRLLESSTFLPPVQLRPSVTPNDYLSTAPGFLSANSMSLCGQGNRAVNLCVSTFQEKIKCDWLAAVSKVYGLQPTLNCVYGANCFVSVANRSADVTIVSTDKLLPAKRDHNLKPLLVQLPKQFKKAKTVAAIVKSNSDMKKLSDLKGKKACFPSVDGIGWTSFIMHMKKSDPFTKVCPYTKAMAKFFSEICISEPSSAVSGYSNIKVCSSEYNADLTFDQRQGQEILYDNEVIAFQCLAVGGGDVAFISVSSIAKYLGEMKSNPELEGMSLDSFRVLCDEASSPKASSDCHLSWASYSQVLVHEKMPPSRQEDVMSLFTGLNNLFGQYNTPSTRTFDMFSSSNSLFDTEDFSGTATEQQRLEQFDDFLKKAKSRSKNYEISISSMEKCSPSSASQSYRYSFYILVPVLILYVHNHY